MLPRDIFCVNGRKKLVGKVAYIKTKGPRGCCRVCRAGRGVEERRGTQRCRTILPGGLVVAIPSVFSFTPFLMVILVLFAGQGSSALLTGSPVLVRFLFAHSRLLLAKVSGPFLLPSAHYDTTMQEKSKKPKVCGYRLSCRHRRERTSSYCFLLVFLR